MDASFRSLCDPQSGKVLLLANFKAALTQPQAISGLGGIGKTQMAVEYTYRYRDTYRDIFWIEAETREEIISGFVTIANLLRFPKMENPDQRLVITAIKRWLEIHIDWLLILDNADDLAMVADFLPAINNGHILLTTRAQVMGEIAEGIMIEKMSDEEGALLLLRRAKMPAATPEEKALAREISAALDGLPLALDQAGAYIEETRCSLSDYLTIYQRRQSTLLGRRGGLAPTHPQSVAATWSLSFQKIERANPVAADLLRLCAFFAPDAIPSEVIIDGTAEMNRMFRSVMADPLHLNTAIGELLKYSLIRRNPDQTLTIHRLVQAVLKENMNKRLQRTWAKRAITAVNRVFPETTVEKWPVCERYLVQAQACALLVEQYAVLSPEAARLLYQTGLYLHDHASYEQAEILYQQALAIYKKFDLPDVAIVLHEYGRLLHDQ